MTYSILLGYTVLKGSKKNLNWGHSVCNQLTTDMIRTKESDHVRR